MTFHSCLYCLDVLHCQTYSIFITSTFSWSPCPHTYSTLSSLPDLPSPDAPSSLHFMPPLVWVLGDKECLCCAGVSSCVLLFLAGCRWAGTVSSALLAGPVCRSLKKFLLSSPLLSGLLKIFTVLGIFESLVLCQSWSSADELKRCVGGKMVRKDDSVFMWTSFSYEIRLKWKCSQHKCVKTSR